VGQVPLAKCVRLLVHLSTDPRDLALGDPGVDSERLDQVIDLAGGDTVDVRLHDCDVGGLVDAPATSQHRREERAHLQFGDLQLEDTGLGRQHPRSRPIAVIRSREHALVGLVLQHLCHLRVDSNC